MHSGTCSFIRGTDVRGGALDKLVVHGIADRAATFKMTPDAHGLANWASKMGGDFPL